VRKEVDYNAIKKFGENLRELRKSKKISMEKLAALTSVEYSQISRIELGQINTSLDMIIKISKALEIDPKDLF
jgi:transcriptional regulator with XRE-family HTH domain